MPKLQWYERIVAKVHVLWLLIQEPRVITCIHLVAYLVTAGLGGYMLAHPPVEIESVLGAVTTAWAIFLLGGGCLGAVAVLPGWWWLERAAVASCITGVSLYAVAVVNIASAWPGDDILQAGFAILSGLFFLVRWFRIRRYSYDPEK